MRQSVVWIVVLRLICSVYFASRKDTVGKISGVLTLVFVWSRSFVRTAAFVTSDPVPAVVGIITIGGRQSL